MKEFRDCKFRGFVYLIDPCVQWNAWHPPGSGQWRFNHGSDPSSCECPQLSGACFGLSGSCRCFDCSHQQRGQRHGVSVARVAGLCTQWFYFQHNFEAALFSFLFFPGQDHFSSADSSSSVPAGRTWRYPGGDWGEFFALGGAEVSETHLRDSIHCFFFLPGSDSTLGRSWWHLPSVWRRTWGDSHVCDCCLFSVRSCGYRAPAEGGIISFHWVLFEGFASLSRSFYLNS